MKRYMYFVTVLAAAIAVSGVLYAGDFTTSAAVIEKNGPPPAPMTPSAVVPAAQMKAAPMMSFDGAMKQPAAKTAEKTDPSAAVPMMMDE